MKNKYEVQGDVTVIYLNRRKGSPLKTLINTKDLATVKSYTGTWYANWNRKTKSFYVVGNLNFEKFNKHSILMHRLIMNAPEDKVVDHMNHDTLDNRRNNLRMVTVGQNNQNRKSKSMKNKSGYRGVYWDSSKGKWRAALKIKGKRKYFGCFDDPKEANAAVKKARAKHMPYSKEAI